MMPLPRRDERSFSSSSAEGGRAADPPGKAMLTELAVGDTAGRAAATAVAEVGPMPTFGGGGGVVGNGGDAAAGAVGWAAAPGGASGAFCEADGDCAPSAA